MDRWIHLAPPALAPRRRGSASATKRNWAMRMLKKARVVEEEEGMSQGEVEWLMLSQVITFIELIN